LPDNSENNKKIIQKRIFPSKTNKKHKKTHIEHKKMTFFEISLDEISYNTPHLQVCIEKKSV